MCPEKILITVNVQVDLNFCWMHMYEGMFFNVAVHSQLVMMSFMWNYVAGQMLFMC